MSVASVRFPADLRQRLTEALAQPGAVQDDCLLSAGALTLRAVVGKQQRDTLTRLAGNAVTGMYFATARRGEVESDCQRWNATTRSLEVVDHPPPVAVHPDGTIAFLTPGSKGRSLTIRDGARTLGAIDLPTDTFEARVGLTPRFVAVLSNEEGLVVFDREGQRRHVLTDFARNDAGGFDLWSLSVPDPSADVVLAGDATSIRFFDLATGTVVARTPAPANLLLRKVAAPTDRRWIAAVTLLRQGLGLFWGTHFHVLDPATGDVVTELEADDRADTGAVGSRQIQGLALLRGGETLVTLSNKQIRAWETGSWTCTGAVDFTAPGKNKEELHVLVPAGEHSVAVGGQQGLVYLFDVASSPAAASVPKSKTTKTAKATKTTNVNAKAAAGGPSFPPAFKKFSATKLTRLVAAVGTEMFPSLFKLGEQRLLAQYESGYVYDWSDGEEALVDPGFQCSKILAVRGDGAIATVVWDGPTNTIEIYQDRRKVTSIPIAGCRGSEVEQAFFHDDRLVVLTNRAEVVVYPVTGGGPLATLTGHKPSCQTDDGRDSFTLHGALIPGEPRLVTTDEAGGFYVFNLDTAEREQTIGAPEGSTLHHVWADARYLVFVATYEGWLHIYDRTANAFVARLPKGPYHESPSFLQGGALFAMRTKKLIELFDTRRWESVDQIPLDGTVVLTMRNGQALVTHGPKRAFHVFEVAAP